MKDYVKAKKSRDLNAVSQLLKNLCFKGFRFFLEDDIFKG